MDFKPAKLFVPDFAAFNGLLIVGDCPYNEQYTQRPFMQSHLGTIEMLLSKANINKLPGNVAFANVLSFYPPNGYITAANPVQVEAELNELRTIISSLSPRFILFLGRQTARVACGITDLDSQRGAPFYFDGRVPALCTYHPREIFRQYEMNIIAISDFTKAGKLAKDGWREPELSICYTPNFAEAVKALTWFLETKKALSVDIETDDNLLMTCIGFGWSKTQAITIPLKTPTGRYWPEHEEKILWRLIANVCERNPLVGHNAVHFDHYVLSTKHKILPNFVSDTMFGHWEVYCEMPKSLAFLNSLYCVHPYWKSVLKDARSGKLPYQEEFKYNAKDTIICLESAYAISKELDELAPRAKNHYRFNVRVSRAFQYMSIRGARFDSAKRDLRVKELTEQSNEMQKELFALAGRELNVRSPKQMKDWLYKSQKDGGLGLPPHYKDKKDAETGEVESAETQDYLTMLKLSREFPEIKALRVAAKLRKQLKRISTLESIVTRPNGYIGYGFNVVGTDTGRASSYKPMDGCGIQAQNQDRRDRDLYLADEGCFWLKADLEGADSWTVAAMLASLGDSTMMYDLKAGLKPAQALGIAQCFGTHLISKDASEILTYLKDFKKIVKQEEADRGPGRTIYDIMKAVSHGSNYGMGPNTMQDNAFKRSDGELYVPVGDCKRFQQLYEKRYNKLHDLQSRMASILTTHGYLDSFSGNRRYFFGRRDSSTVRVMLSQLPQSITSFITNQLLDRLYHWKENRCGPRSFILAPLNQVHDETDLAFRFEHLDRARSIFEQASRNKVVTWGIEYSIPFEANYGTNWGDCYTEL